MTSSCAESGTTASGTTPLVRPRYEGEPRHQWIGNLAWAWLRFTFWLIVLIVISPYLLIEWLDDCHEELLCAELEQKMLREEIERERRRQPLSG